MKKKMQTFIDRSLKEDLSYLKEDRSVKDLLYLCSRIQKDTQNSIIF